MDQSNSMIKGGLINIQSVNNKTHDIRDLINDMKLDFLAMTETWLSDHENAKINEMTPSTHNFFSRPRGEGRGGGVGIFLSKNFKKVNEKRINNVSFEGMQVNCEYVGRKIVFLIIYRPPRGNKSVFNNEIRNILELLNLVGINIILCGDFNLWFDDHLDNQVSDFKETLALLQLTNVVQNATSSTGHILDLVCTDINNNIVRNLEVENNPTISPVHKLITFSIMITKETSIKKKLIFRDKRGLDSAVLIEAIHNDVLDNQYSQCTHNKLIKNCTQCFSLRYYNIANTRYNDMCPISEKEVLIKDHSPWFCHELLIAKRNMRRRERMMNRLYNDDTRKQYKISRNAYFNLIRRKKREYYQRKTKEAGNNIKKLYKILESLTGKEKDTGLPDGFNDLELANMFADYFEQKIDKIVEEIPPIENWETCFPRNVTMTLTEFKKVDEFQVKKYISKTNATYCVVDPFPIADVKDSDNFELLTNIYMAMINISLDENIFPNSEKLAIVRPLLKGTLDKQSLKSYRPISNLPFFSKILENAILEQLLTFMDDTGVLPDNQSAYRQLYSVETALCKIVNDLIVKMDEGKCSLLILLDLSAAFDTVVHELLFNDLQMIGIQGNALNLIKSYVSGREYQVKIGKALSNTKALTRGVPQGSVLGPILFCIYTIELAYILRNREVKFQLFADDTQFYMTISDINHSSEQISDIMTDIKKWMNYKKLKLNEDKTECLLIGKKNDIQRINIDKVSIMGRDFDTTKPIRNLGVIFDNTLDLRDHINHITSVAGYHLRNLTFLKKYLNESDLAKLIHNHVISRLDFCNSLYYGLPNYLLIKLQKILYWSARLLKGLSRRERVTPILIELHWLPIKARIVFKICTLVFQAMKYGKPQYMRNLLKDYTPNTNMSLRHVSESFRLEHQRSRLQMGNRAFEISAPRLWNRLPENVRASKNIEVFKKRLKTFLFSDCFDIAENKINDEYKL